MQLTRNRQELMVLQYLQCELCRTRKYLLIFSDKKFSSRARGMFSYGKLCSTAKDDPRQHCSLIYVKGVVSGCLISWKSSTRPPALPFVGMRQWNKDQSRLSAPENQCMYLWSCTWTRLPLLLLRATQAFGSSAGSIASLEAATHLLLPLSPTIQSVLHRLKIQQLLCIVLYHSMAAAMKHHFAAPHKLLVNDQ